jgi:hypothetical protein
VIEEGAFIGSDTQLVAPVTVGKGAVTAAGTTVYRDVPAGALALTRPELLLVEGWVERKRQRMTGGGGVAGSARPSNGVPAGARAKASVAPQTVKTTVTAKSTPAAKKPAPKKRPPTKIAPTKARGKTGSGGKRR